MTRSQSSGGSFTAVPGRIVPALLKSASSPPKASTAVAIIRSVSAASATSAAHGTATAPCDSIIATVSSTLGPRTSAATTCAPSAAKRSALARPMPDPAPVTMAILPSSNIRASSHGRRR